MKKIVYIISSIFLSLQLSFLVHALIESLYIKYALAEGKVLENTKFLGKLYCVLPNWLNYGLLILAIISGYFLGQYWWRVVYIEKRHWRFRKNN